KPTAMFPCLLVTTLALAAGCEGGGGVDSDTAGSDSAGETGESAGDCVENEEVPASITEDTRWACDKLLPADTVVTVSNGAVLTVGPGVTVRGKSGSALVIAQGSRLEAAGTADQPIVFTSSQAEGSRNRGDWGGIVLLGKA